MVLLVFLFSRLAFAAEPSKDPANADVESVVATGFSTDLYAGVNITNYSGSNLDGGVHFAGGVKEFYFVHQHVGFFLGLDYSIRAMSLTTSEGTSWLDIPFGIAFRYKGWTAGENSLGLGAFYSLPLTSRYADAYDLQGGVGIVLYAATYFKISPGFDFGIFADIKYSFFSPITQADYVKFLTTSFGIVARFGH